MQWTGLITYLGMRLADIRLGFRRDLWLGAFAIWFARLACFPAREYSAGGMASLAFSRQRCLLSLPPPLHTRAMARAARAAPTKIHCWAIPYSLQLYQEFPATFTRRSGPTWKNSAIPRRLCCLHDIGRPDKGREFPATRELGRAARPFRSPHSQGEIVSGPVAVETLN